MVKKPKGWRRETARHNLAARGIKTGTKKRATKPKITIIRQEPKHTHTLSASVLETDKIPHVAKNEKVAEAWSQGKAAQTKSMYSTGSVVYSYGPHFPIPIKDNENGKIYLNKDKYSPTTSTHQTLVRRNIYGNYKVVRLDTDQMKRLLEVKEVAIEKDKGGYVL